MGLDVETGMCQGYAISWLTYSKPKAYLEK